MKNNIMTVCICLQSIKNDQRIRIKFCFRLGKTSSKTIRRLQNQIFLIDHEGVVHHEYVIKAYQKLTFLFRT